MAARRKGKKASSRPRNIIPVVFLLLLTAILAYAVYLAFEPQGHPAPASSAGTAPPASCRAGDRQYCTAGNCTGTSVCMDGMWSGCTWARVCAPGTTIPCFKETCPQGIQECNSCGTGYGSCTNVP